MKKIVVVFVFSLSHAIRLLRMMVIFGTLLALMKKKLILWDIVRAMSMEHRSLR